MQRSLSQIEAASIMVGAGVGGGIMAVPYLAARAGMVWFWPILAVALAANILLHLMLAEVLFRDGRDRQVVELIRTYAFRGRWGEVATWFFFLFLLVAFIANLTAYIAGSGELLAALTGGPLLVLRLAVYIFSVAIVFLGLKSVGVSEMWAIYGAALLVLVIVVGVAGKPFAWRPAPAITGGAGPALALFSMVMYSLYSFFAVPQVIKGLRRAPERSVRAIVLGLVWNALLIGFFVVVATGVAAPVTEIAIEGIGRAAGPAFAWAGSLFVVVAMLTSYWSVSLALADIVHERTAVAPAAAWAIATTPTLLLILVGWLDFLDYLQIAGGLTGLVVVMITVPMYVRARREGPIDDPPWTLGRWASPPVLALLLVCTVLMAVGALF